MSNGGMMGSESKKRNSSYILLAVFLLLPLLPPLPMLIKLRNSFYHCYICYLCYPHYLYYPCYLCYSGYLFYPRYTACITLVTYILLGFYYLYFFCYPCYLCYLHYPTLLHLVSVLLWSTMIPTLVENSKVLVACSELQVLAIQWLLLQHQ